MQKKGKRKSSQSRSGATERRERFSTEGAGGHGAAERGGLAAEGAAHVAAGGGPHALLCTFQVEGVSTAEGDDRRAERQEPSLHMTALLEARGGGGGGGDDGVLVEVLEAHAAAVSVLGSR